MGLILSIESSTNVCSVALHKDGILMGFSDVFIQKSHSQILTILCENLISYCGINFSSVDAIAISSGPGSYTGLRIGSSTAKGFCYALDKPLIGVNTLEAMALGLNEVNPYNYMVCPMIDARRMEVYTLLADRSNKILNDTAAVVVDQSFLAEELLKHKIIFAGNGASKCKSLLSYTSNAIFIEEYYPSAKFVGKLAESLFTRNRFEDVVYFEPDYLKEFNNSLN